MASTNNYPKLHNAMWPGIVGKGTMDSEPIIPLDTLLTLTRDARGPNGEKFDGVDLFITAPHLDIDSDYDAVKRMSDHIASYGLKVGSFVAPIWGGAGGGSAMGSEDDRKRFVSQVKKASAIGEQMRNIGIRPTGGIRVDSSVGVEEWDKDPKGNTKKIAETFKEAAKAAQDHGEFIVAEGEICWGGMHSWRENVNLLEMVDMPGVVGYQADMAHSMLFVLGANSEKDRLLPKDFDWSDKAALDAAYQKVADALRPWTYDFHVAQNDGSTFGSGDHAKTGRHCQVTDPNGKLDVPKHAGYWLRDEKGDLTKKMRHICWDGCMFPNAVMEQQETWNAVLATMVKVRDAHGWRELEGRRAGEVPMRTRSLNVGMVGYGFMGRAHSNAYRKVGNFFDLEFQPVLKAACGRDKAKTKGFADRWGYESVETDWKKLIARKDIDAVDICVPNDLHVDIAIAAAKAGKMVLTEKPIARNAAEGRKMVAAVEKAKVPNMVWYNYRRVPAVMLIKQVVDQGLLGRIYHYRANFLQDWTISPDVPQGGAGTWRLDLAAAGSGVTGDLIAHCVDTAMWINGPIDSLSATTETFVKKRKHAVTGKVQKVGIDDAAMVMARFGNGSLGLFESTRYARGHKALYTLEINGENGSFIWNLHDLNYVQFFDHRTEGRLRGWTSILVTDGEHPYLGKWWVPGLSIGYEHSFVHQIADFLEGLSTGKPASPTFREALATTVVCDAIIKSGATGKWQSL